MSAKISERFIFVWSGESFGLSNRLAVESVLRHHPGSTIEIHLEGPEPITLNFLLTRQLANVEIHNIDVAKLFRVCDSGISKSSDLLAVWQRIPRTALSARSNLLRYALLYLRGGIYLDFDILMRRPLDDIMKSSHSQVGAEFVWKLDEKRVQQGLTMQDWPMTSLWAVNWWLNKVFCTFSGRYSPPRKVQELIDRNVLVRALNNAVIVSQPHSDLTTALLENAQKVDPTVRFSLGPSLLSTVVEQEPYLAHIHQPNAFFAVPPGQSYRFFIDECLQLPDESFLIHYVSSNHGELLNSLTPESIHDNRSQAVFWKMASALLQSENFERQTRDAA